MNKKQELIEYVIGNEFITKPSLQDKFTKLLDEALAEQLILHGVVLQSEQLKCDNCKCTPTVIHNTPSGRFCEACRPVTL